MKNTKVKGNKYQMAQNEYANVFPDGASLFSCIYQALIRISLSSYSLATARLKNQLSESIEKKH